MTRLLVIGGSDAGILAGLRAREVTPGAEVTLVVEDTYPNFAICGSPYDAVQAVAHAWTLAHQPPGGNP